MIGQAGACYLDPRSHTDSPLSHLSLVGNGVPESYAQAGSPCAGADHVVTGRQLPGMSLPPRALPVHLFGMHPGDN